VFVVSVGIQAKSIRIILHFAQMKAGAAAVEGVSEMWVKESVIIEDSGCNYVQLTARPYRKEALRGQV